MELNPSPYRHVLPRLHRDIRRVAPELRDLLRKLVAGTEPWPLCLFGPVGTGKTLAALALSDMTKSAAYWTVEDLAGAVMQYSAEGMDDQWMDIRKADLAILDELGCRQNVGDLHYTTTRKFIDERDLHGGLPTIYITNINAESLAELYDERVASRICRGTWFETTGEDQRLVK